jgi:recombination protein RecA
MGVEQGIVRKSGAWYTYEGDQLGQGKENARNFLRDNPDLANEIEKRIKEKLGVGPRIDVEASAGNAGTGNAGTGTVAAGNGSSANGHPAGNGAAPSRTAAAPSRTAATVPGVTV